jgi:hypothetical protein
LRVIEQAANSHVQVTAMEDVMTQRTATIQATAMQPLFKTDLREFGRNSAAGAAGYPLRLADFARDQDLDGRSEQDWVRANDRAVGALIGIAFTSAVWATWAMVVT